MAGIFKNHFGWFFPTFVGKKNEVPFYNNRTHLVKTQMGWRVTGIFQCLHAIYTRVNRAKFMKSFSLKVSKVSGVFSFFTKSSQ